MRYELTIAPREWNLNPTETEEVIQNVLAILLTAKGTVPLDRSFGLDASLVDKPINIVQSRLAAEAAIAIREQEPRARLLSLTFEKATTGGELVGRAVLDINL